MKKTIRILSAIISVTMLISCICLGSLTASAAYVTDGNAFYAAGDATGDGNVDVTDLVAANIGSGTIAAVDLDGDGTVGSYDYALIRAMILGIDNSQWTE
jgi:hypothetical protein